VATERWQRLSRLFEVANSSPPAERTAAIDQLCGADAELRADLEALLAADQKSFTLLDAPWSATAAGTDSDGSCPLREGDRVGPYRLGHQIGEGGMSVVFAAQQEDEHYSRRVAIKLLKAAFGNQKAESFGNECRILARLEHPNIARLYDAGRTESGIWYLAMEYVDGEPLDRYVEKLGAPRREIELFTQVCAAVSYAHRNLIVHRDLKPSNILVTPEGTVKLLDFGIARLLDRTDLGDEHTTLLARPLTPQFSSPEQLRGEPVNVLSDVYSLGIVLYRCLAGQPPYRLESISRLVELMNGDLAIPRPSTVAPTERRRRLRGDLDAIVLKALAFEPAHRYPSVEQLARDLERHVAGLPIEARPPALAGRALRMVRRHPLTSAAVTLALVLSFAFTVALARSASHLAREQRRADAEAVSARAVSNFLIDLFEASDPSSSLGDQVTARELLDRAALDVRSAVEPPAIRAALADALARAYAKLDLVEQARPLAEHGLALRTELFGERGAERAESLETLSWIAEQESDLARAEELAREALELRRASGERPNARVADAMRRLAAVVSLAGRVEEAEALFQQAVDTYRSSLGPSHVSTLTALADLGKAATALGEHGRASERLTHVLPLLESAMGADHPEITSARIHLARSLTELGHLDEAETIARQSVDSARRVYTHGPHTGLAIALDYLSQIQSRRGEIEEALQSRQEALDIRLALFPETSLSVAYSQSSLARALDAVERFDEAENLHRRAIASVRAGGPPLEGQLTHALHNLADSLVGQNRASEAEPLYREILEIFARQRPAEAWRVALTEGALAHSLELQGRETEALEWRRSSYLRYLDHLGPDDPRTHMARDRLQLLDPAGLAPHSAGHAPG
jgi:tetratricopeptide (TPR) repeat protein/predicted Ser/Thr protein kinase